MNKWQIANGFNLANVADAIANLLKITIDSIEELYYCKFRLNFADNLIRL